MPTQTADHKIVASHAIEIVSLPVDWQVIKAVTLFALTDDGTSNDCFATIGLLAGGATIQNQVAAFSSGYVGPLNPLTWTGSLPFDADGYIFAQMTGTINSVYRLSTVLWKIRIDDQGEFRADP